MTRERHRTRTLGSMKSEYFSYSICTFLLPVLAATEKWLQMIKCDTEVDPAWTSLANLTVKDRLQCAWACYANITCDHVSLYEGTCMLWKGEATCGSSSGVPWTVYKVVRCDAGWYRYKGSCYLPVALPSTWTASVAHCASLGSHLVSIRSLDEQTFIVDIVSTFYPGWDRIWIGASDLSVDWVWEWMSGEAWGFEDWMWGEPSGYCCGGIQENCAQMTVTTSGRRWNDDLCDVSIYNFGCEKSVL